MAKSEMVEVLKKGQKSQRMGKLKMKVIRGLKNDSINRLVKGLASGVTEVDTGNSTSYVDLKDFVSKHNVLFMSKDKMRETLPWIPIATGNAKQQLVNTFHDIKPEFLQNHFDEFCCNLDCRYHIKAPFNSLLGANADNH